MWNITEKFVIHFLISSRTPKIPLFILNQVRNQKSKNFHGFNTNLTNCSSTSGGICLTSSSPEWCGCLRRYRLYLRFSVAVSEFSSSSITHSKGAWASSFKWWRLILFLLSLGHTVVPPQHSLFLRLSFKSLDKTTAIRGFFCESYKSWSANDK